MAFDEDAGPPRERNEGLIALLRRRGLKSKQAGRLYGIQIEGIQDKRLHTQLVLEAVIFSYN